MHTDDSAPVPLVSVITVVFRAKDQLRPVLQSIVDQLRDDAELIVIDGGSDDGTVEVLRDFGDSIAYWVSERDCGIYDAMNKGISLARGEYVLHINAGDRLLMLPRDQLHDCLKKKIDVACFSVNVANWGDYPPRMGIRLRIENSLNHQGIFYRRINHPLYDLRYRVFSDFDCNQRMIKSRRTFALFQDVVAAQSEVGVSRSGHADREIYQIVRKNYGIYFAAASYVWRKLEGTRVAMKYILDRYRP